MKGSVCMAYFDIVVASNDCTVVNEYIPEQRTAKAYQSEAALEQAFIEMLTQQGYEYVQIHKSDDLVANLRRQLEKLNNFTFTDDEWKRFFSQNIVNSNHGIEDKSRIIQEDNVQVLKCYDGSSKNINTTVFNKREAIVKINN